MQFSSRPIAETPDTPLADGGRWERLVERFARRDAPAKPRDARGNAAFVVSIRRRDDRTDHERQLDEILGLVEAHGDRVVGHGTLVVDRPHPRTFIGPGQAETLAERAFEAGADLLVVDAELSPSQMRNLEDAAGLPIADREAVILEVFEAHATSRRARLQVEVAHLEYLRPRIRGLGLEMDQQAAGLMTARGPGETASELLARRLDGRLADLRRALAKLKTADRARRRRRDRCARIALVGYTNAGKSSLMNAVTGTALSTRDRPFETLDATSRCLTRHGGDVVLHDTVGFIRRLPERLMASFESTLAEIEEATLLAVVVDASDPEWPMHLAETERVLTRLAGGPEPPARFYVFNKIDRVLEPLPQDAIQRAVGPWPWMAMSAHDPSAASQLRRRLIRAARDGRATIARVFVPYAARELLALVHRRCQVLATDPRPHGMRLTVEGPPLIVERIRRATEVTS